MIQKAVIVGGVAGGASCAARLRRLLENADIILLEKGPYVSFSNCGLPYYTGGVIRDRGALLIQTADSLRRRFQIDVRVEHEVIAIDREKKQIEVRDLAKGVSYFESYDVLVLSPGASAIRPSLPGINLPGIHTLRNIPDVDAIVRRIQETNAREAVVLGGGYIGLEMVENLKRRGLNVALVEKLHQVMPLMDEEMAAMVHFGLRDHGIDLHLGDAAAGFEQHDNRLEVRLESGTALTCDLVILSIGVRPETRLGRQAGLEIGRMGGLVVDDHMRTNDPAIYAIGDAVETINIVNGQPMICALAGPANRQGRIVADCIMGREVVYQGSQGTAICRVFDQTAAITGLSESSCRRLNLPCESIYITAAHHAGYYPGAEMMTIKLVFSPTDGKILGAQIVGGQGVDKRIDVLATALRARMTVFDLEHLELAYAPQFGAAKDPVNVAGFVAAGVLRGDGPIARWEEVDSLDTTRQIILDVRTSQERSRGAVPGSIHIPVDELRSSMDSLPRDREILVHCASGLRSYLAVRILLQKGFKARNLTGGYKLYTLFQSTRKKATSKPIAQ